ncbi:hypothetical protein HDZ31DRAFT_66532 [Schizophyllum fasciatum]
MVQFGVQFIGAKKEGTGPLDIAKYCRDVLAMRSAAAGTPLVTSIRSGRLFAGDVFGQNARYCVIYECPDYEAQKEVCERIKRELAEGRWGNQEEINEACEFVYGCFKDGEW